MKLTPRELQLIRGTLIVRRMYYRDSNVWQPWMQSLLQKIEDELEPHHIKPWSPYNE